MSERDRWGRVLACGCVLGRERCMACRYGLDPDQEKALAVTLTTLLAPPPTGSETERDK